MNIWHDISPERIQPEDFTAVIEIPKGGKNKYEMDKETGLRFRSLSGGPCLNLHTEQQVREGLEKLLGNEFLGCAVHEQYFYEHYYNYQPDYADKLFAMSEVLHNAGYRFVTTDELN